MADNTVMQQGRFTSLGAAVNIPLRSGVDWMRVYNITQMTTPVGTRGIEYYWQAGFPQGAMMQSAYNAGATANLSTYSTSGGFTYVDSSMNVYGLLKTTITAISTAAVPVVAAVANGVLEGQVVRLSNVVGAPQLGGMDFTVSIAGQDADHFLLAYMAQLSVAGTTADWMLINYDPIYYPRRRFITKISQATSAVVTMSVTHGYKVGQLVRMIVPAIYGMIQMNGLQVTITAVDLVNNTITINVDSSAFSAFAFPTAAQLSAAGAFTQAQVVPMGEDTADALSQGVDILTDATLNTAFIGMQLAAGVNSPAGSASDVIYWQAGTVFNTSNM